MDSLQEIPLRLFVVCVCLVISDSCHFMDCSSAGSSQWDFSGKNAGVGCHFPLQGIFPTQGSNPHVRCLQRCRRILYLLSHKAMLPKRHMCSPEVLSHCVISFYPSPYSSWSLSELEMATLQIPKNHDIMKNRYIPQ